MIPNGCEAEHFAAADQPSPPQDVRLPGPVAGFVSHMSERIDLGMLEAVASSGIAAACRTTPGDVRDCQVGPLARIAERPMGGREELPGAALLLASDRCGADAVLTVGLQPSELPAEYTRVPRRRSSRRGQRPAGPLLAEHRTREHRPDTTRVRRADALPAAHAAIRAGRDGSTSLRRPSLLGSAYRGDPSTARALD